MRHKYKSLLSAILLTFITINEAVKIDSQVTVIKNGK